MTRLQKLFDEIKVIPNNRWAFFYYTVKGYLKAEKEGLSPMRLRALGDYELFANTEPYIYKNDLIVGSMRSAWGDISDEERDETVDLYVHKFRGHPNSDHFAPHYDTVLEVGISGLFSKIKESREKHAGEPGRVEFLDSMEIALNGLVKRIEKHAELAENLIGNDGYDDDVLLKIKDNCNALLKGAPETFEQALQLVWFIHNCFTLQNKYAMALGRIDRYLYPFYKKDIELGILTKEYAVELLENTFVKICERFSFIRQDDVVNIAIGGVDKDGKSSVNELSFCVVEAVKNINRPGPNLSARISSDCPDEFLDACLKSLSTGLGYPALMNDDVNIPALLKYGYDIEDARNYSMVGCIENFITGMQQPWLDGRFDTPRFFEYVLNEGKGVDTGKISEITTMDEFLSRFETQVRAGAKDYVAAYAARFDYDHPETHTQPFLSLFCVDCIGRGLDLSMGGAKYPSVYGAAAMGIGTVTDSLAAIEQVVFVDKAATLEEVRDALNANFVGYEELHKKLLAAPKYGNNDDRVDKWAVWFVKFISDLFNEYKSYDGGYIYTLIAANVQNISAGKTIGATPDGRLAGAPLSDAGSPTYGKDKGGPTTTILSVTKPDYTCVGGGTVLNQKFSPAIFEGENRKKLLQLIRVYFARGGQEIQINSITRQTLIDAMENPENYENLVVRVSGFSALFNEIGRSAQEDILNRTQQSI